MTDVEPTTRAYTLKLSGSANWRETLWKTHLVVNRGARVWGDWLLTLRGGLPATLANDHPDRRVMLALSWLSVEGPTTLITGAIPNTCGKTPPADRSAAIMARFQSIL